MEAGQGLLHGHDAGKHVVDDEPEPADRISFGQFSCTRLQFWTTSIVLSLVLVFIIVAAIAVGNDNTKHVPSFIHLTDLHMNPLYDPTCNTGKTCSSCAQAAKHSAANGRYGCDPPYAFVQSLLNRVASMYAPSFVLVSGDLAAHDLNSAQQTLDAIQTATASLKSAFGNTRVFPTVGNNDHQGVVDYCITPGPSTFLDTLWGYFQPLGQLPASQEASFKKGGYYSLADVVPDLTLIVYNSVFYSPRFNFTTCGGGTIDEVDPADQFAWMEGELKKAEAARNRVILLSHIPPAGDQHSDSLTWRPVYITRFLDLVEKYSSTVHVQLYGHFHRDEMRVQKSATTGRVIGAALCAPSVSPVFGGNPGFRYFNYSARVSFGGEFSLLDYEQLYVPLRYASLPIKNAYFFNQAYSMAMAHKQPINKDTIAAVVDKIRGDGSLLAAYDSRRFLFHGPSADDAVCALDIDASLVDFDTCKQEIDRYDIK